MNAHKRMDANRLVEEKPISVFAPMYGKEKCLQKNSGDFQILWCVCLYMYVLE